VLNDFFDNLVHCPAVPQEVKGIRKRSAHSERLHHSIEKAR
jgi:hypothetical protein